MKRVIIFLPIISILILFSLTACRSEQAVVITSAPPTESSILSGRPDLPAAKSTRTPRPQETATLEATLVPDQIATASTPEETPESVEPVPISLEGSWLWASITDPVAGGKNISTPSNYLILIDEGAISLTTNCNATPGTITYDDDTISIVLKESSLADCPLEEQQFIEKLNSAETFIVDNGRLQLNLDNSDITLELGSIDNTPSLTWDELLFNIQNPFHQTYCDAPAAILLVNSPTELFLDAFGTANLEANTPILVDTPMEIGNNTSSFTNVIILQLEEEGLLSLDDPFSTWLPDIAARIPNGEQITLRHLAQNTSGIPDYANVLIQPAIDNLDRQAIQQSYAPQDLVDIALTNRPEEPPFSPGAGWQSSGTNALLLGLIAEQVTEQKLSTLYQERIFDPLNMTNSYLAGGIPEQDNIAQGYHSVNGKLINFTDWNTSQGWAGGGIVSTAEDMSKYIRGLFKGTLFQSVFTLSEMVNFVEADGTQFEKYGLGIGQFANTSSQMWGHEGQTPGFTSIWSYVPENDAVVVMLANSGSCTSLSQLPVSLIPELLGLTSTPQ